MNFQIKKYLLNGLWNAWCICSIIGIWPRFIEPRLLFTSKHNLKIDGLADDLKGFKILQFSDLHFNSQLSQNFLDKISKKIKKLCPDLIICSGDLINCSFLEDGERLQDFLSSLSAPYGCFTVLGNHDYEKYVTLIDTGYFDVKEKKWTPFIVDCFKKIFSRKPVIKGPSERVKNLKIHQDLDCLLKKTPFKVLENETKHINVGKASLNISGLGDYWLGQCLPEQAFLYYDEKSPGIIVSHNPDTILDLKDYPGDLILAGHTHGGQVNLPFLWRKFISQKEDRFVKGWIEEEGKKMYISRGLAGQFPFRCFAPPELLLLTLS